MPIKLNLVDSTFLHHPQCSIAGRDQISINWLRENFDTTLATVYTDASIGNRNNAVSSRSIAWTIESQAIQPNNFVKLRRSAQDFDLILTHDTRALESFSNARFSPGGGVWIGGSHAGGKLGIHHKRNLLSLFTSKKLYVPMHGFRLAAALFLRSTNSKAKVSIGSKKVESWNLLESYAFNVAIENYIDDYYFTERLLNCFATGTIPIYFGARKISSFFNPDGILTFNSMSSLQKVIKEISFDLYEERLDAISENFELVQSFLTIEDYIATNYASDLIK